MGWIWNFSGFTHGGVLWKKGRGCKGSIGLKIQTAPIYYYFGTQAAFNLRNVVPYLCFVLKVEICKNTSLLCLEKLNLLKCKVNDVFCSLIKLKQKKSTKYQVLWFYLFSFKVAPYSFNKCASLRTMSYLYDPRYLLFCFTFKSF